MKKKGYISKLISAMQCPYTDSRINMNINHNNTGKSLINKKVGHG